MAPTLLSKNIREHKLYTSSCHAYTPCRSVSDSPSKRLQPAVAGGYHAWLLCAAIAPSQWLNAAHRNNCCCCCKHTSATRQCRNARADKVQRQYHKVHVPARTGQASTGLRPSLGTVPPRHAGAVRQRPEVTGPHPPSSTGIPSGYQRAAAWQLPPPPVACLIVLNRARLQSGVTPLYEVSCRCMAGDVQLAAPQSVPALPCVDM